MNGYGRALSGEAACEELCEALVDYLNFFEFVASLWKLGQLELDEIMMMFEYYIRLFSQDENRSVMLFIEKEGFENLEALIRAMNGDTTKRV